LGWVKFFLQILVQAKNTSAPLRIQLTQVEPMVSQV